MKKPLTKTLAALAVLLMASIVAFADTDKPIEVSQLPTAAQQTLKTYFADRKVALAKVESDLFDKNYDVIFTNGDKMEFNSKGEWTEVQCKQSQVPAALVPSQISSYVKSNYPGQKIIEIEKESKEYEVKLGNGIELTFDKKFRLTDID